MHDLLYGVYRQRVEIGVREMRNSDQTIEQINAYAVNRKYDLFNTQRQNEIYLENRNRLAPEVITTIRLINENLKKMSELNDQIVEWSGGLNREKNK